jgi:hypothetical protein
MLWAADDAGCGSLVLWTPDEGVVAYSALYS